MIDTLSHITALLRREEPGFFLGGNHMDASLIYAESGNFHCVWEGKDHALSQGEYILLPPESWYLLYAEDGIAPCLFTLSFRAALSDFAPYVGSDPFLTQLSLECKQADNYSAQMICLLLSQLLLTLQRRQCLAPRSLPKGEQEILFRAQKIIHDNARYRLSVPLVAQKAGVSASYLTALFHKHLPFSPAEYMRRVKLRESQQMIREGQLNFTQIAQALEYSTVHQFSRQFKEVFGITPTEYAKKHKALVGQRSIRK